MQLAVTVFERCCLRPPIGNKRSTSAVSYCQHNCLISCSCRVTAGPASSSTAGIAAATAAVTATALCRRRRRRPTAVHALFGSQPTRQLWDYQGSYVRKMSLEELQLLHRLSFGHRNQRSYLIVIYQPESQACQEFEAEVERLATGLRHERAFVAAALDMSSRAAADFATKMLGVCTVPAVLLYPEAARGCLRFLGPDMSAAGMLTAINNARLKVLPPSPSSPGAAEWRLMEAGTPLAVTAIRAAAATGDREALLSTLQQQMTPIQPTPIEVQSQSSLWSGGRLTLWGGMLLCSLLFLAWDLKLSDVWEDWNLLRRQEERARGKRFTFQENLDDFTTILMAGIANKRRPDLLGEQQQQQQSLQGPSSGDMQVQHELDKQQYQGAGQTGDRQLQQHEQQQQQEREITMKQQQTGGWVVEQTGSS